MINKVLFLSASLFFLSLQGCGTDNSPEATVAPISVTWAVDSVSRTDGFLTHVTLTIDNQGEDTLFNRGWTIYYSHLMGAPKAASLPRSVSIENVTGDFQRLAPTPDFSPLPPQTSRSFSLRYAGFPMRKSYAPHGMYIVFDGKKPRLMADLIIEGINVEVLHFLSLTSPSDRYEENALSGERELLIPRPAQFEKLEGPAFTFEAHQAVFYEEGLKEEAQFLRAQLRRFFDMEIRLQDIPGAAVKLILEKGENNPEAYRLSVKEDDITIAGSDLPGLFYGIQSFLQMMAAQSIQLGRRDTFFLPPIRIEDRPRFGYRGLHLDVSRNFHSLEKVKSILDLMAFYKLNKFHFTLTNDEGWRLEIPGLPELTEVGAFRGHTTDEHEHLYPAYGSGPFSDPDLSYGSGYYSREEYIELLRYAAERHIEIIPEIDVPGHARAAIIAMRARYRALMAQGDKEGAEYYRLDDPADTSRYRSAQNYRDNVICVCRESAFRFMGT
ncbi:MAG: family 20 glycosylhydrolase, partial [Saprospiraceae bacterium]|nr:family 20 glycosylhydrolase [Saprospiraceae bacterium]